MGGTYESPASLPRVAVVCDGLIQLLRFLCVSVGVESAGHGLRMSRSHARTLTYAYDDTFFHG